MKQIAFSLYFLLKPISVFIVYIVSLHWGSSIA